MQLVAYLPALLAIVAVARAADPAVKPLNFGTLPAVDGINGKIMGFGGWIDPGSRNALAIPGLNRNAGTFGAAGALSVPLGHSFGLQLDATAASVRGTGAASAAIGRFSVG